MSTQEQEQIFHILKVYGENISCYYNNILEKEFDDEDLHLFRTNIRRSRALLDIFYLFFEEERYTKINETLLNITQNTNKIRDLTVFLEAYRTSLTPYSTEFPESFYSYLFNELENEKDKLYQFLKIDTNQQDFNWYLMILEDRSKRKDISTDMVVYVRDVVTDHFKEIIAFHTTYKIDGNEKNLHKIRISLRQIYYLFESFENYQIAIQNGTLFEQCKIVQKKLGRFNDLRNWIKFIQKYIKNNNEDMILRDFEEKIRAEKESIIQEIEALLPILFSTELLQIAKRD